jgi:type II secretory pathway pseudopilin PulG
MHNRRAVGSEKEEAYIEVARERLQAYFSGNLRVRPMGKPVFQPTGREKVSQLPDEWQANPRERLLEKKEEYR